MMGRELIRTISDMSQDPNLNFLISEFGQPTNPDREE